MYILCSDLESVLLPELWVEVAKQTKIEDLKLTTRDIADMDLLMQKRISALRENGVSFNDLQEIVSKSEPLEGAVDFLRWARKKLPVIILSDAFWEFVSPIAHKMDYPTVFCNFLEVDEEGFISGYKLREDGKRRTVEALQQSGMKVIAMGDSYNDVRMIQKAEKGIFFNASDKIKKEFPSVQATSDYEKLKNIILETVK
jgi:phosphoserine/homoserine phosphotransferase